MIEVIDNFVNSIMMEQIEHTISQEKFGWDYCKYGTQIEYNRKYQFKDANTIDRPQFVHNINTEFDNDIFIRKYLLHCMEDYFGRNFSDRLIRAKINMLTKDSEYGVNNYHIPHVDDRGDIETVIYYVNDSDGDTFVFNEKPDESLTEITIKDRISPVRGRLVLFDSSYLHASSSPVISSERIIINFVFRK
jgi:hypothetical protein